MSYAATETTDSVLEIVAPLGAGDVCDSCGAQAYVRVTLHAGDLLFCGDKIVKWHDETDRLRDDRAH
jgi:hypothetical protein